MSTLFLGPSRGLHTSSAVLTFRRMRTLNHHFSINIGLVFGIAAFLKRCVSVSLSPSAISELVGLTK